MVLADQKPLESHCVVAVWFIAMCVSRAVCKLLLRDTSVIQTSVDGNVVLSVLLISTSWIPLATDFSFTKSFTFELDLFVVKVDPVVWTQLLLVAASHVLAWNYKLGTIIYSILRYRCFVREARGRLSQRGPRPLRKVLIIHASVGAGHKRAAQAVKETFEISAPEVEVTLLDVCDIGGKWFNALYKHAYLGLVDRTWGSFLVGYLFELGNVEPPGVLKRVTEEIFLLDFIKYLYNNDVDMVVHTHFLALEILSAMRRREVWCQRQVCVVTDFDTHAFWAVGPCEHFFVAREEAKLGLLHHGVPEETVSVTGIPIVPSFVSCPDRQECLEELDIMGVCPVVLLISFGPGVVEAYKNLLEARTPLEVVVITGRQADIRKELEQLEVPERHRVKLEGFTAVMEKYMCAADIIVTKPGGLITCEALASGLAMIVVSPYPGQEVRNTDMLLEEGCAIKCSDLYMLGYKVDKLLADPKVLASMQSKARQIARPRAAFEVVDMCIRMATEPLIPLFTPACTMNERVKSLNDDDAVAMEDGIQLAPLPLMRRSVGAPMRWSNESRASSSTQKKSTTRWRKQGIDALIFVKHKRSSPLPEQSVRSLNGQGSLLEEPSSGPCARRTHCLGGFVSHRFGLVWFSSNSD